VLDRWYCVLDYPFSFLKRCILKFRKMICLNNSNTNIVKVGLFHINATKNISFFSSFGANKLTLVQGPLIKITSHINKIGPSLCVHPHNFLQTDILIYFSETTGPIENKHDRQIQWMILYTVQVFCPMLSVSLDCTFLITPSVFSNIYLSCVLCAQCCLCL
jgi:hypothetical protein